MDGISVLSCDGSRYLDINGGTISPDKGEKSSAPSENL